MRKFYSTLTVAALMTAGAVSGANAAAVTGFGANDATFATLYDAASRACTVPLATPLLTQEACQTALNEYTQALIAAGVPQDITTASLTQLRSEVDASGDVAAVDGVFDELLPRTGSTNPNPSPTTPG